MEGSKLQECAARARALARMQVCKRLQKDEL